ncbi:MAG: transporter [Phycisphaerales bacterium]|nr:transporter [Phycisphaerales bacterium]
MKTVAGKLIFTTGVAAVAGFLYGYDTGIIYGALLQIRDQFGLSHRAQELVASAILVGAVLGAVASRWAVERVGRRRTVTLLAGVYVLGAIGSGLAPGPTSLALARVFAAMNVLAFVFIYRWVPETAGKSLEQIENTLRAGDFRP